MAYYDEWSDEYKQELIDAGATFSDTGVPLSGLNVAVQTVEGAYDEETDTGFTATGTGSFLATVNEDYRSQSEATESDAYAEFIAGLQATDRGRAALATWVGLNYGTNSSVAYRRGTHYSQRITILPVVGILTLISIPTVVPALVVMM